jgi:pSer/pThr/pTyr-binding forkhead associated (FHA) protein
MQDQMILLLAGAIIGFMSAIGLELIRHTLERKRARLEREINLSDTKTKTIKGFLDEDKNLAWLRLIKTSRTPFLKRISTLAYSLINKEELKDNPKKTTVSRFEQTTRNTIRKYVLSKTQIIGRQADCEIQLSDKYVSRVHAMIRYENEVFVVYDLGSTTGTFVNGEEVGISKIKLEHGDRIEVGESEFVFEEVVDRVQKRIARRLEAFGQQKDKLDSALTSNTVRLKKKKYQKPYKKSNKT